MAICIYSERDALDLVTDLPFHDTLLVMPAYAWYNRTGDWNSRLSMAQDEPTLDTPSQLLVTHHGWSEGVSWRCDSKCPLFRKMYPSKPIKVWLVNETMPPPFQDRVDTYASMDDKPTTKSIDVTFAHFVWYGWAMDDLSNISFEHYPHTKHHCMTSNGMTLFQAIMKKNPQFENCQDS